MQTTNTPTRSPDAAPTMDARLPAWVIMWLAALMVVTVAARMIDPTPWLGSDDASYHAAAEFLLQGETITRVHHHYGRLSVILAVAASMAVFGNTTAAVVLPTILLSSLTVLLAVGLGRLTWNWWVGLCAGSIVSVLPYFRVLSTTAYPDVHACFWAALAALLVIGAVRAEHRPKALVLAVASGLALGLAASAKIFTVWALVGLVAIVVWAPEPRPRRRLHTLIALAAGGAIFFVLHGLAYAWLAGDFWYKWHALTTAQGQANLFPASGDPFAVGPDLFLWQRLTFFFEPFHSGWGLLAVAFWPAALYILVTDRRGRPFAFWAITGYLLVAFFPVSFEHGIRPYPSFVGRNILFLCVPFAICLAGAAYRLLVQHRTGTVPWTWPVPLGLAIALAYAGPDGLRSFRDRPTSRIAAAIDQLVAAGAFDHASEIHMTPSMYWRFRVLFPEPLRDRLRVSTDDLAPPWWRETTTDILALRSVGIPPQRAILLATPAQLSGATERWDYGVGLDATALHAWGRAAELELIDCGALIPAPSSELHGGRGPLLVLRRHDVIPIERRAESTNDADMG